MIKNLSILLLSSCSCLFLKQEVKMEQSIEYKEFYSVISNLENKILHLKGYDIDSLNNTWTAIDHKGHFSFSGEKYSSMNEFDSYKIKVFSFFRSEDSCCIDTPTISCDYHIYRKKQHEKEVKKTIALNFNSSSYDEFPFQWKDIKYLYCVKEIAFGYSTELTFDNLWTSENYVVEFKNGTIKKYFVDQINYDFVLTDSISIEKTK